VETSYIKFIQKSKINHKSYFLYGNEEVLRQDCSELISKNFCSEGYSKLVTFGLDGFDNLEEEILKLLGGSLFQEKLIIKIKHLEGRFPEILKKLIEEDKLNTNDQKCIYH
jgi:DNA polymerase III delta subunit